ncbi:MAG: hypothetical protein ABL973_14210 [Micropepsaceae bacterium]
MAKAISFPTDLRALDIFDRVPKDCVLHKQDDGAHEPHIHMGELAVIDPTQCDVIQGELYLIRFPREGSERIFQVNLRMNSSANVMTASFQPLNRPQSREDLDDWLRTGRQLYMGDCGLIARLLPEYIVGRVIGVLQPL